LLIIPVLTTAQDIKSASEKEYTTFESEPLNGYWKLYETRSEVYDGARCTKWTTGETITALSVWKDLLNIEHTIGSSFTWEAPPNKMMPGLEVILSGTYDNIEYSTTNKIYTGIKIFMDRAGTSFFENTSDGIQVINVRKDNKLHTAEIQKGKFIAPKHFVGEGREIQIMVDCFIGKDHYITTYFYSFIESSNL
jgi:hypothetical protein